MHRVLSTEARLERSQVGLRLLERDARTQPAEHGEQAIRAAKRSREIEIRLRNPEVQVGRQRPVPGRCDADNGPALGIETYRLTKDVGPAAEKPLPESMADDDAHFAIVGVEPAPHDRD